MALFSCHIFAVLMPKSGIQRRQRIYAEVVTCVAGSLEAIGLPGYPKVFYVEINVVKS
jgi:hypothetical protein